MKIKAPEKGAFLVWIARGRPYKMIPNVLVGASIARPRKNGVTLLWNTSSTADAASAVPLPLRGRQDNAAHLRYVICRDRRPRLSVLKRCYFALRRRGRVGVPKGRPRKIFQSLHHVFVGRGHARNPQSSFHSLRGTPRAPAYSRSRSNIKTAERSAAFFILPLFLPPRLFCPPRGAPPRPAS